MVLPCHNKSHLSPQIRRGTSVRLANNSVLEIAGLKFVFLINQDLIEAIRLEATKMYQNS
jgi:hypothetical protein